MAFPCWHVCPGCGKSWCHQITNPCAELDDYFLPCGACARLAVDVVEESMRHAHRRDMKRDGEDGAEVGAILESVAGVLLSDDIPEEIELPELIARLPYSRVLT